FPFNFFHFSTASDRAFQFVAEVLDTDSQTIDMSRNLSRRSSDLVALSASLSLLFVSALSNDSSGKDSINSGKHSSSSSKTGSMVAIILLGFLVVVLLSFFLFKLWQKKRREEQYARLLKLFEEDDELEVELGLRD
ncbi:hypothetical protein SDJN02_23086, partial [Cucurbita argyrosperma subsp. argyrosperma]